MQVSALAASPKLHDNHRVTQASQLSPELGKSVLQLSRAILAASRNWTLYPPEHPAVAQSLARLADAIHGTSGGSIFSLGITPDTLLVEGAAADRNQASVTEAAAFLHDRDLLRLTFVGTVPPDALQQFLKLLTLDAGERRARGGPANIWATDGHTSIALEQVDYRSLLEREHAGEVPESSKRDDVWRSIVLSISGGYPGVFDEAAQQRLLAIAGSAPDIGDLATAVMAPKCTSDGSPLITSQAATVLAAFRHLSNIVSVAAPDRLPEVMGNLATAATELDPHVVMQVLQTHDDPNERLALVTGVASAFDDTKVAQLLATALALDGQASDRLATIFNTIAPDEDRKRRVMTLTRDMLGETDFGKTGQFEVLWTSMEELLVSYNDKPFVSESYRTALDGIGARAERFASADMPAELGEWMETLGQENVRTLSVMLLIDLLTIEQDDARATAIASDMAALAEDLLMSGAYADAKQVTGGLAARAGQPKAVGRDGCRQALDRLGESIAMRETAALLGDIDDEAWPQVRDLIVQVGISTSEGLKALLTVEDETLASQRAAELVAGFGPGVVSRLSSLVGDSRWFVQRTGARLLGRIAAAEGIPLLQPLIRKTDPRVAREAIRALGNIDDPGAARAIHTVMRAATGDLQRIVSDALVADRDPRVAPMLARILDESQPLGKDHDVVLRTLEAIGTVGSDQAVPAVARAIGCRSLFNRAKRRAVKERGVEALVKIGGPRASSALEEASRTGDRMLRKVIRERA